MYAAQCPQTNNWEVSAEFLYLMPTADDTYFVLDANVSSTTAPNGKILNNNFSFSPGFRVGAGYDLANTSAFELSYTWLQATQNRTVTGSFLWATVGAPDFASTFENYAGSASSNLNSLYESLEARFTHNLWHCNDVDIELIGGIESAYMRLSENYTYQISGGALGTVYRKGTTWGVGPQVGFGLDYVVLRSSCNPSNVLSLVAVTSGSLLTGESRSNQRNVNAGVTLINTNYETTWRVFPAFHAKLGVNYDTKISNFNTSFGIGYEFNSYIRSLLRPQYYDDVVEAQSYNVYDNYDNQGLYVSANLRF